MHRTSAGFEHSSWQFGPEFGKPFSVPPPAVHWALGSADDSRADPVEATGGVVAGGSRSLSSTGAGSPAGVGSDGAGAGLQASTPTSANQSANRAAGDGNIE